MYVFFIILFYIKLKLFLLIILVTLSREFHHNRYFTTKNASYNITIDKPHFIELLFTRKSKIGWFYNAAMPTGWAIIILMIIMDGFSLPFCRKKGYFQVRTRKEKTCTISINNKLFLY